MVHKGVISYVSLLSCIQWSQLKINRLLLVLYKYNRRIAMRGIDTQTKKIREQVFEEVARAAYSTGDVSHELEEIPYKITPSDLSLIHI